MSSNECPKRQRHAPPTLPMATDAAKSSLLAPLTSVTVVCRDARPSLQHLPHVAQMLSAFLDVSPTYTVARACSLASLRLLERVHAVHADEPYGSLRRDPLYLQWQFSASMRTAAAAGELEIVQWLTGHFRGFALPRSAVVDAIKHGHVPVLEWLHAHYRDINWHNRRILGAVDGHHLNVAKWLEPMDTCRGHKWIIQAASVGNLEMVKWAYGRRQHGPDQTNYAAQAAGCNDHLEVMRWLLVQKETSAPDELHTGVALGYDGGLELLELLIEHSKLVAEDTWPRVMECAIRSGNLPVVKRLHEFGVRKVPECAFEETALGGHLETLKWSYANQLEREFQFVAMDAAAESGHLDVVRWFHETDSARCSERTMASAAANGHLEVVQWLHEHGSIGSENHTMNLAAANGHLAVVQWLHANRTEGCTINAMDYAAREGHLEVVKWLHANRSEGCTTDAMDDAASCGHLDVVKWLHANRTEGCTSIAMDEAAGGSVYPLIGTDTRLEIVQWLHVHRSEGCTTYAMDEAVLHGRFEIVLFLHRERTEGCSAMAAENAFDTAPEFLPWMYLHYREQVEQGLRLRGGGLESVIHFAEQNRCILGRI